MITHKELLDEVDYNPKTGLMVWKRNRHGVRKGTVVGSITSNNYRSVYILGEKYLVHKLIWFYITGEYPDHIVDHIDRNSLNNKWDNLRKSDKINNARNTNLYKTNTSGVMGVNFCNTHNKWKVRLRANGKRLSFGYYENLDEAVIARYNAERKYGWHDTIKETSSYLYLREKGLLNNNN